MAASGREFSKIPVMNLTRRIRRTASSIRVMGTDSSCTHSIKRSKKLKSRGTMLMSMPAITAMRTASFGESATRSRLYTRDRVADSPKEAVRMAVMAGIDMSMVPLDFSFFDLLIECVHDESVPMTRIDDAVRRILRVKFMTGIFENSRPDAAMKARFDQPAFAEANLAAAQEAITLLKNDNHVLPLARGRKILVTGPTAHSHTVLNSGWSRSWLGGEEDLFPQDKPTLLDGIVN